MHTVFGSASILYVVSSHTLLYVLQDFAKKTYSVTDWTMQADGTRHPENRAVKGAVLDFSILVNRQISITYEEVAYRSWLIRK